MTEPLFILLEEFRNAPKYTVIDRPFELVLYPKLLSEKVCQQIGTQHRKVYFTRRSLKHLSDKKHASRLIYDIGYILTAPDEIRLGKRKERFLLCKKLKKPNGHITLVCLEISKERENIIVTAFGTDERYVSNFDLLWRTESLLKSHEVPPSAYQQES